VNANGTAVTSCRDFQVEISGSGVLILLQAGSLVVPTTGNEPAEQAAFQDDTQPITPAKRRRSHAGFVAPEVSQQFEGVHYALFRDHDALGVVASDLQSREETSEVPTVNENRNVVSLEKRRHDRNLGLRLWEQHSYKSHNAWSALWPGSTATHRQLSAANAAESSAMTSSAIKSAAMSRSA